jgi:hypothetical protein
VTNSSLLSGVCCIHWWTTSHVTRASCVQGEQKDLVLSPTVLRQLDLLVTGNSEFFGSTWRWLCRFL